ncbi:MAG: hypothetical protein JWM12_1241 [Ilumatobacteraceae bacterium]|nr:hypothetical protein [Ilumatobacteraceae bacterium]
MHEVGRRRCTGGVVCQTSRVRLLFPIGLLVCAAVTGCGSPDNGRTDANYCAAVNQHLAELNAPSIATAADVTRAVSLYRAMSDVAPLAVEKEWDVLTIAYQTAATVVPGDQASMQHAVDTIRASQQSANAAADYTLRLCNIQIGTPTVPTTLLSQSTTVKGATTTKPG